MEQDPLQPPALHKSAVVREADANLVTSCDHHTRNTTMYSVCYDNNSSRDSSFLKKYKEHCVLIVQHFKNCSSSEVLDGFPRHGLSANLQQIETSITSFWKNIDDYKDVVNSSAVIDNIRKCDLYTYSVSVACTY